MADYKQVILVRDDLKLTKGKMSAQVGHASVETVLKSDKEDVSAWRGQGMKKVVLKVADLTELNDFEKKAKKAGLVNAKISDAGRTVVEPGTVTCLGIGPDEEDAIDELTGNLKML